MASLEVLEENPALPVAIATESTNAITPAIEQRKQRLIQAMIAKQRAKNRASFKLQLINELGNLHQFQMEYDRCADVIEHQQAFSDESRARNKAARVLYQQRVKEMDGEIAPHAAAIAALNRQLDMVKAEHAAQHTLFDMLDAQDLQLEDERRLPAAAGPARHARQLQRDSNAAMVAALDAEVAQHTASIARARDDFAAALRRDCMLATRTALRELVVLRGHGAALPHGERKMSYWNALRRATTSPRPSAADLDVYEAYNRDLRKPLLEKGTQYGVAPSYEAFHAMPQGTGERSGMFSISGWKF